MQTARKVENDLFNNVIELKLHNAVNKKVQATGNDGELKYCFQTDKRYSCKDYECIHAGECKKLIAEWMR